MSCETIKPNWIHPEAYIFNLPRWLIRTYYEYNELGYFQFNSQFLVSKSVAMAFLDGLLTGLFLQFSLGPVFFYIVGITLDSTIVNALFAIAAVTIVDYFYILLAIIGVAKLIQRDRFRVVCGVFSSLILVLFGVAMIYKGGVELAQTQLTGGEDWTPLKSFSSCFVLTILSPMTIVFFTSIFSAKAIDKGYQKGQLYSFGFGTGFATVLFLTLSMFTIHLLKTNIPSPIIQSMNCIVGIVLIYYGVTKGRTILVRKSETI